MEMVVIVFLGGGTYENGGFHSVKSSESIIPEIREYSHTWHHGGHCLHIGPRCYEIQARCLG
jgi:hypothetical protein